MATAVVLLAGVTKRFPARTARRSRLGRAARPPARAPALHDLTFDPRRRGASVQVAIDPARARLFDADGEGERGA
jgi:hypothetical protein